MKTVAIILSISLIGCLIAAGFALESCGKSKVVKADTGEVVQESDKLPVKSYDPEGDGNAFHVVEYKHGGVTYLIFIDYQTGIHAVNYTLDSLEVSFHKEHLDKTPQTGFSATDEELVRSTKNTNSWSSR